MSFYNDLTFYDYHDSVDRNKALNIGWLGISTPFNTGSVSDEFVEKLWEYGKIKINMMRGYHSCDFCGLRQKTFPLLVKRGAEEIKLGYAEIRVFGKNNKVYAAPNLVFHYITEHGYKPPDEFIQSVMAGPDPSSVEYMNLLKQLGFEINSINGILIAD